MVILSFHDINAPFLAHAPTYTHASSALPLIQISIYFLAWKRSISPSLTNHLQISLDRRYTSTLQSSDLLVRVPAKLQYCYLPKFIIQL